MRAILKQWGALQGFARTKASASDARLALTQLGILETFDAAGATWNDFQKVYGLANRNQIASELFAAAQGEEAFSMSWAGITPNSRTYEAMSASPTVRIRVNITFVNETGTVVNQWTTVEKQVLTIDTKTSIVAYATTLVSLALQTASKTATRYQGTLTAVNTIALTLW